MFAVAMFAAITLMVAGCSDTQSPIGLSEAGEELMDWGYLAPPDQPNNWLLGPDTEQFLYRDELSPMINIPAARLADTWVEILRDQPRTEIVAMGKDGKRIEAIQRSLVFGFVDRISSQVFQISDQQSTIAIYSRATSGYWDLGVNRRRVQSWLQLLEQRLDQSKR